MIQDLIFGLFFLITIIGAFFAVSLKKVFYNALALGFSFFGIAGIYIFLHAEFLAALQIIVYIGAIAVAIVFAIMMSDPIQKAQDDRGKHKFFSFILCGLITSLFIFILVKAPWPVKPQMDSVVTLGDIGHKLLTQFIIPFEVVSLILLIAIVGSLVLLGTSHKDTEA